MNQAHYIDIIAADRHELKYKTTTEKHESPTNDAQDRSDVVKIYYNI